MSQGVGAMASSEVRHRGKAAVSSDGAHAPGGSADGAARGTGAGAPVGPRAAQPARTDGSVWRTFGFFSVAILGAPLAAFYGAKDSLLGGNAAHAAALAVVVVNVVLIGYIVMCLVEHDRGDVPLVDPVVPIEKETRKDK